MKGNDFTKVHEWYANISLNSSHLVQLLNNELSSSGGKNLFKTLNIFKAGFFSEDKEVTRLCGTFFTSLMMEINNYGGEIVGEAWEWFARPTFTPEPTPKTPVKPMKTPTK